VYCPSEPPQISRQPVRRERFIRLSDWRVYRKSWMRIGIKTAVKISAQTEIRSAVLTLAKAVPPLSD
jgi:hypothetical protein